MVRHLTSTTICHIAPQAKPVLLEPFYVHFEKKTPHLFDECKFFLCVPEYVVLRVFWGKMGAFEVVISVPSTLNPVRVSSVGMGACWNTCWLRTVSFPSTIGNNCGLVKALLPSMFFPHCTIHTLIAWAPTGLGNRSLPVFPTFLCLTLTSRFFLSF